MGFDLLVLPLIFKRSSQTAPLAAHAVDVAAVCAVDVAGVVGVPVVARVWMTVLLMSSLALPLLFRRSLQTANCQPSDTGFCGAS